MKSSRSTAVIWLSVAAVAASALAVTLFNRAAKRDAEGFDTPVPSCPDVLVRQNGRIVLYRSDADPADGEFPKTFENIDGYIAYVEAQRARGIRCKVLYLQEETDAQGNNVLRARPSPFQNDAGARLVPAHPADIGVAIPALGAAAPRWPAPAGGENSAYTSFDAHGFDAGSITGVDILHESTTTKTGDCSENPMDSNWCGVSFTANAVANGKYADNEVRRETQPSANPRK
jgi:hypothetical protein